MLERTFPKEQVKKREEHQKKEHHRPREERVGEEGKRDHFGIASGDVEIDQDSPYTREVTY
jgi:hypothetical protein